eukprot:GFYU01009114.1.p1 GENE.GFYU01009114.1~~GFYU01009114.1.p1  ORF type:complete len:195 (-),score=69.74 GFYU01009114.1:139-642(-)
MDARAGRKPANNKTQGPSVGKPGSANGRPQVMKIDDGHQLDVDELREAAKERIYKKCFYLRNAFLGIDTDHTGFIERDEFRKTIADMNLNVDDGTLDQLVDVADVNGDGKVDYNEFAFALKVNDAQASAGAFGEQRGESMLTYLFPQGGGPGMINENVRGRQVFHKR